MTTITGIYDRVRAAERARASLHQCEECGEPARQVHTDYHIVQNRRVEVDVYWCDDCASDAWDQWQSDNSQFGVGA
jgi:uncharacterized protein with PIN domain